ncbi:hypothetical protein M440DRAFT_1394739 [Trichoderma longibrachiatum ATCC 18648]|uniref:Uncharacterized protein n=1 Tax=Trichoderma longibrachiatum ATCC 18648 TaxID=983965 RepID=A0A2T4BSW5_TRILO|nr:hypothetical protein M440DRAFT_1394739 [Trichoderma longibrachiatum ATCC 18648]
MSDYTYAALYLYSSKVAAPVPLANRASRTARRDKHARRPQSTSDAAALPSSSSQRHSRSSSSHSQLSKTSSSSSSAHGPAASASVGLDSASPRLSPATSAASASANTAAAATAGANTANTSTTGAATTSRPSVGKISTSVGANSSSPQPSSSATASAFSSSSSSHVPPPSSPAVAQTPTQSSSRTSRTFSRLHRARLSGSASAVVDAAVAAAGRNANAASLPDQDPNKSSAALRPMTGFPSSRAESVSSASGQTTASSRTIFSTDPSATEGLLLARPFVQRNGRTFLNDHTLAYPLPSDLTELHRQPESKGKEPPTPRVEKKTLTPGQIALRQTALLTQVQEIQALEPILREVSGKSQDEWDMWLTKMMSDLMDESGTALGECLEFGAWYAKKKKATS